MTPEQLAAYRARNQSEADLFPGGISWQIIQLLNEIDRLREENEEQRAILDNPARLAARRDSLLGLW